MGEKKVFVNKQGIAVILCPECKAGKEVTVEKFRTLNHTLNIKCPCGNTFRVILDYRQNYRKSTQLSGFYKTVHAGTNKGLPKSRTDKLPCRVVNLSRTGLRLWLLDPNPAISVGAVLQVAFQLDDKAGTAIDRKVVVKNIKDVTIGCEYVDSTLYGKEMGFYLMT